MSESAISAGTIITLLKSEFPEYPILSEEEYIKSPATPVDTPYFNLIALSLPQGISVTTVRRFSRK